MRHLSSESIEQLMLMYKKMLNFTQRSKQKCWKQFIQHSKIKKTLGKANENENKETSKTE